MHESAKAPGQADVGVGAVNGPEAVVISGAEDAVTAVAEHFAALGRRFDEVSDEMRMVPYKVAPDGDRVAVVTFGSTLRSR
mgnify:CR=1 FL=1